MYLSQENPRDRGKVPEVLLETAKGFRTQYRNVLERMSAEKENLRAFLQIVLNDSAKRARYLVEPRQFLRDLCKDKALRESVRTRGVLSFWNVYPTP